MNIQRISKIGILLIFVLFLTCCFPDEPPYNYTPFINVPWVRAVNPQTDCAPAAVTMWAKYDRGSLAASFDTIKSSFVLLPTNIREAVDKVNIFTDSKALACFYPGGDTNSALGGLNNARLSLEAEIPSIIPKTNGVHSLVFCGANGNYGDEVDPLTNKKIPVIVDLLFRDPAVENSAFTPDPYGFNTFLYIWTPNPMSSNTRELAWGYERKGKTVYENPEDVKNFYRYNGTYYGGPASYIPEGSEFVRISFPIGTDQLYLGQQKNIEWESNGLSGNIKLELLKGDTYWGTIATDLPLQQGSYAWTVGQYQGGTATVGDDYKIKITMMDGSDYDTSNVDFSSNEGDVPGNPPLISPAENAEICTTTPTFNWNVVTATPAVNYYQVQVNIVTTVGEPSTKLYVSENLTNTSFIVPANILESGKNYKWFVRVHNEVGWGEWSGRNLNISVFSVPDVPVLNSPANNATVCSTRPTFKWGAVTACPDVDYYQVQINIITTPGEPSTKLYVSANIIGTSYTLPANILEGGKNYKWFVRAHNAEGWGEWSGRNLNITVFSVPANPILNSPADNVTVSTTRPTFTWSAISACPAVDYYQVQVNIVPASGGASTKLYVSANLTATSFTMPANILASGNKYKWFVRAHNAEGWGGWSGRNLTIQ